MIDIKQRRNQEAIHSQILIEMGKFELSYTNASNYFQNMQKRNFENAFRGNHNIETETKALCDCIIPYLTQVLSDIPDTELYDDNHLKHSEAFVSEIKSRCRSLDFANSLTALQKQYKEDFSVEYFDNALMTLLNKLELIPDYTFFDEEPTWIDILSDFWIGKIAQSCKGDVWNTTKAIRFVSYKMPYSFQKEFGVSERLIEQAIADFEIEPSVILYSSHLLTDMVSVESLISEYNPTTVSVEQIGKYVEHSGYVHLPENFSYLISQCVKNKRWDLWISIWDRLYHPVLQYQLLWPNKSFSIIDNDLRASLLKCKNVLPSVSLYFHYWLKYWKECMENLYTYEEKYGWLAEQLKKEKIDAKAERESLENGMFGECNSLLEFLDKGITPLDIVKLASGINSLADTPDSNTKIVHEFIRTSLIESVCNRYQAHKFNVEGESFPQLLILSRMAVEANDADDEYLKSLWVAVESSINADDFYWSDSITSPHQHNMLCVAKLFMATHPYRVDVIDKYVAVNKVRYEGWVVKDVSRRTKMSRAECYLLCAFLMSLLTEGYYPDNDAKGKQLISIVDFAIRQDKNCDDKTLNASYQRAVLHLAKCIALQKLPSQNDIIDHQLISNLDNFTDLVTLLINSSSVLSEENKKLFKQRYDAEWKLEKQYLSSCPYKSNIEGIEKGLEKIIQ